MRWAVWADVRFRPGADTQVTRCWNSFSLLETHS